MDRPFEQVLIDERKLYLKLLQRVRAMLVWSWEDDCDREPAEAIQAVKEAVKDIERFKRVQKVAGAAERREIERYASKMTHIADVTHATIRKHEGVEK